MSAMPPQQHQKLRVGVRDRTITTRRSGKGASKSPHPAGGFRSLRGSSQQTTAHVALTAGVVDVAAAVTAAAAAWAAPATPYEALRTVRSLGGPM